MNFFFYGSNSCESSRCRRLLGDWPLLSRSVSSAAEKETEEKKLKFEWINENSLKPNEVENLKALSVMNVDLNVAKNALSHKTKRYNCTKKQNGHQCVLRRGQEFCINITFNRPYYKKHDDLFFVLRADDKSPSKHLQAKFQLNEDGKSPYKERNEWGGKLLTQANFTSGKSMEICIYIPGNCVIADWDLTIKTKLANEKNEYIYLHDKSLIILFNPWSKADEVFMPDEGLLEEYVLSEIGEAYFGNHIFPDIKEWTYDQFQRDILGICLLLLRQSFGLKMSPKMADAATVSRALSRIVNCQDDNGVLVGNWSGNYDGGRSPSAWCSSANILRQYSQRKSPVKYGQCWVFSHILTAVCRALGLPCRSVTNFGSAHDTDGTCTVDCIYDENGEILSKSDSIWNFHVWNDVWMNRNDLNTEDKSYDGWQAIDATPQEVSYGCYQCGPSPVNAIKDGEVNVGFDTTFIFAEVNADVIDWIMNSKTSECTVSSIKTNGVGNAMLTKKPNASGWENVMYQYKYAEGSVNERKAVERAVRLTKHSFTKILYTENRAVQVAIEDCRPMLGQDCTMNIIVNNMTNKAMNLKLLIAFRSTFYYDHTSGIDVIYKQIFSSILLQPKQGLRKTVTLTANELEDKLNEDLCFCGYACATDLDANMPYSDHRRFTIAQPTIILTKVDRDIPAGMPFEMSATMKNPFKRPMQECRWEIGGTLSIHEKSLHDFTMVDSEYNVPEHDIPVGESCTRTISVYGTLDSTDDDDDEKKENKYIYFVFFCKQLRRCISSYSMATITN